MVLIKLEYMLFKLKKNQSSIYHFSTVCITYNFFSQE